MEHVDDLVLGRMLLERGKIKPGQLESTRSTLPPGKSLAQGLVDARIVTKEDIENILSHPTVHPKPGKAPIRPDAAAKTRVRSAPPDDRLRRGTRGVLDTPPSRGMAALLSLLHPHGPRAPLPRGGVQGPRRAGGA